MRTRHDISVLWTKTFLNNLHNFIIIISKNTTISYGQLLRKKKRKKETKKERRNAYFFNNVMPDINNNGYSCRKAYILTDLEVHPACHRVIGSYVLRMLTGKFVPVHAMKARRGWRSIAHLILNTGIKWKSVINLRPRLLLSSLKKPRTH
jgi:hypothetical protein